MNKKRQFAIYFLVSEWKGQLSSDAIRRKINARVEQVENPEARAQCQDIAVFAMDAVQELCRLVAAFRWNMSRSYRSQSEKIAPGQLALALIEHLAGETASEPAPDGSENSNRPQEADSETGPAPQPKPPTPKPKPRRKRRKTDLSDLERIIDVISLPADERVCDCCHEPLKEMGYDKRERLEYQPASLHIVEERILKYATRCGCDGGVSSAQPTPKPIPGGLPAPSTLARIVVAKTVYTMPFYRQSIELADLGIALSDKRIGAWFAYTAELLSVFQPAARAALLRSGFISFDDTRLPTLNREHPKGIHVGRLWLYLGDYNRVAYCQYSDDWKGIHPCKVLAEFDDVTQQDGYGGTRRLYQGLTNRKQAGCHDHARRKVVAAFEQGDQRAGPLLAEFAALYRVERLAKGLGPDARLALRQAQSVPIWQRLDQQMRLLGLSVSPRSALGKAITYWCNQNKALQVFLHDGRIPISNAHVERLLRLIAVMRRNSLFVGSSDAGRRYAAVMTLVLNCSLADVNPFDYFQDIIGRIAAGWPVNRIPQLLPATWLANQRTK